MTEITDNDIKKALECCGNVITSSCKECLYHSTYNANCVRELMRNALDLINRKDAEIEKLNVELVGMRGACNSYKMHYDNAQAEIERLKHDKKRLEKMMDNLAKDLDAQMIRNF